MDKKLNQQLDEKLRESYGQLPAEAPKGLWERLQEQLPEESSGLDQVIDEKIAASYKQLSVVAPGGVWALLENGLSEEDAGVDQQLDEKIKKGFAQQSTKIAPLALWTAISKELPQPETFTKIDAELDAKLKASYEEEQLHVPQKIWLAVNRQLNLDRTWQRISVALDAPSARFDWKLRGLQLAIVLMLLLLWVRTCNVITSKPAPVDDPAGPIANTTKKLIAKNKLLLPVEETTTINNNKSQTNPSELANVLEQELSTTAATKLEKAIANRKEATVQPINNYKDNGATIKSKTANQVADNTKNTIRDPSIVGFLNLNDTKETNNIRKEAGDKSNESTTMSDNIVDMVNISFKQAQTNEEGDKIAKVEAAARLSKVKKTTTGKFFILATNFLNAINLPPLVEPIEVELANAPKWKRKAWLSKNRLAVGVFTSVNSTVLLNNETRAGFDYNSLTINYFGLAANYGLWARYRLNKKSAVVLEYSINADHRQAYGVYRKGQFVIEEHVFKYNRIALAYQMDLLKLNKGVGINNKVTAQLGTYIGSMRAVRVYYDKVLVSDRVTDYHDFDLGIKVALGHEIAIDHFIIGYGIRADVGVANIFKGNREMHGQEDKTNLIHLGAYIQLGYQF